jgi:hypothetical protein
MLFVQSAHQMWASPETKLLFIVSAMKSLLGDEHFVALLRAERLDTLPHYLAEQIKGKEQSHA